jgi:hypothetical protein
MLAEVLGVTATPVRVRIEAAAKGVLKSSSAGQAAIPKLELGKQFELLVAP